MKLIIAIIKPFKLDDLHAALANEQVAGMTVTEVQGYGRQKGHKEIYRGAEYFVETVPKIKIELVVPADRADAMVQTIIRTTRTGEIGDGKVFVIDVERAFRIRTGEADEAAL
jgi:nitrogen regulatory protein PII